MKVFFISIWFVIISLWSFQNISAQCDLQCKFLNLQIGKTNVNQMKKLFGSADTKVKRSSWIEISSTADNLKKLLKFIENPSANEKVINLYTFEYKQNGLVFDFFDKTNELYSIEITKPNVSVSTIKVGSKLNRVIKKLGKNDDWTTSEGNEFWTLDYEKLGLKFIFQRDKKAAKFPMKLDKKKVIVRIEMYNNKIAFS
jgi:hypothetical protein